MSNEKPLLKAYREMLRKVYLRLGDHLSLIELGSPDLCVNREIIHNIETFIETLEEVESTTSD